MYNLTSAVSTLFLSFSCLLTRLQFHWTAFRYLSTTAFLASGPLHLLLPLLRKVLSSSLYISGPFSLSSSQLQHHPSYFLLLFPVISLIAILHIYLFLGTFSCLLSTFILYHENLRAGAMTVSFTLYTHHLDKCLVLKWLFGKHCVCSVSGTLWTTARQSHLSMKFSRQEYWSGLQFLTPGDLLNPRFEPIFPASPELPGGFFTTEPPGSPSRC